jgi:hypothetical protein
MSTESRPQPVDTAGDEDDLNHLACPTRDRTWCGQDARNLAEMIVCPPIDTFCRICVLAYEMHRPGDPCPVCGTLACIS